MRALEALPDKALGVLAAVTNWPAAPPARLAPRFWEVFAELVAHEVGCRRGLLARQSEPGLPAELPAAELEGAALVLAGLAAVERTADPGGPLAEFCDELAGALVHLRRTLQGVAH